MLDDVERLNISEIASRFNLPTPGDAWALVIDNDWPITRPNGRTWIVEVPKEEIPDA